MTLTPLDFREALSRLASAVTIVATDGPAGKAGLTCSAVTSVSDQPATVLVCVKRTSRSNGVIKANKVFTVNALVAGQEPVADVFAGRGGLEGAERFATGAWDRLLTGAPALAGARMTLDCRLAELVEVGTHSVLFGQVEAVRLGDGGQPLVYADRRYHAI